MLADAADHRRSSRPRFPRVSPVSASGMDRCLRWSWMPSMGSGSVRPRSTASSSVTPRPAAAAAGRRAPAASWSLGRDAARNGRPPGRRPVPHEARSRAASSSDSMAASSARASLPVRRQCDRRLEHRLGPPCRARPTPRAGPRTRAPCRPGRTAVPRVRAHPPADPWCPVPRGRGSRAPRGLVRDEHGRPVDGLPGTDARAVPPSVVDVGDADARRLRIGPRQDAEESAAHALDEPGEGRLDAHDVLAGQVGTGVRSGPGIDDRMLPDELDVRVVPPATQVVAHLVVRGEGDPPGKGRLVALIDQEDRHLLPVGLVVVDSAEGRAPVVHRVEVPVLQDDVAAVTRHVPVVGMLAVAPASGACGVPPRPRSLREPCREGSGSCA